MGGVIFWPLFLFAVTLLVLATSAHATDDNTVSIEVDQNAALQPAGNLYKATTNVTVKTGKPYGFNLVMQTATRSSDLINSNNSTRHIYGVSYYNMATELSANQWGYALNKQANKFIRVPSHNDTPAVIADVTKAKPAGCTNPASCTKSVTFAANVDPAKLASGSYNTAIMYTATAKPKPAPTVDPTICKSGDPKNDCQVDLDPNMIPVKYTGTTTNAQWTSLAKPEDSSNQGNWYNYNQKQWANAITVKKDAIAKYKGQTKVVDQADILGFWVYIPRYAYEVMRRDGTDEPVEEQDFLISFEKTTTPKRQPAACSEQGKDYREDCDLDRSYIKGQPSNQGTWATHPAFTFGTKELNGIWFAKFETTGTISQPTVLPNEAHISGEYSGINGIGSFYSIAKSLGVNDPNNVGGNSVSTTQDNHNLAKLSSHMVNNNDWGAATYLSASKYGAGYDGVQVNGANAPHSYNGRTSHGTTGCGPRYDGETSAYYYTGALGTQYACVNNDLRFAYNGTLGQLTSTTNNPTGVYDMSGGGKEYVAASYSSDLNNSSDDRFSQAAHPPYVNTYNFVFAGYCTFITCGGQALYETRLPDLDDGSVSHQWNDTSPYLADSSYQWFMRGGSAVDLDAGIFSVIYNVGNPSSKDTFRVALAPAPHD